MSSASHQNLQQRFDQVLADSLTQFQKTASLERHWLVFTLLGWEHLITCIVCHVLLEVYAIQIRWPYVVVYLTQIAVMLATVEFITGRPKIEISPLERINRRMWTMFVILCINIAVLNVIAGHKIFDFMPALAALSSFGFTFLTTVFSKRFMPAGLAMFAAGIIMAKYPDFMFLIYGGVWLVLLQTIGIVFWTQRSHWLPIALAETTKN